MKNERDITPRIIIDYDCKFIESLIRCNVIINGTITQTHTYTSDTQYTRIHIYTHPEIRVNDNKNKILLINIITDNIIN